MTTPVAVLWAFVATAGFVYLATRSASYVWGRPPVAPRVLRALELGREPPRFARPWLSPDVWILLAMLGVVEFAIGSSLTDAMAAGDRVQVVGYLLHFLLACGWLIYLRARYAAR